MYYKVLKDEKVVDVLDYISYAKYDKNNKPLLCLPSQAQMIVSSDRKKFWHIRGQYAVPVAGYETMELIEIDEHEYRQLKMLNGKTPEEIIDEYTLYLIEEGLL